MVRFTVSLSAALDRLADVPVWSMTAAEQREALVELHRQRNRLRELELRVLVQADRDDVGADSGAVSTPAWLAHATSTSTAAPSPRPAPRRQARRPVRRDPGRPRGRRDRRGEGRHRHRRGGAADRRARRPAARHRRRGRRRTCSSTPRPSTPPTLRRLGKRLFEVVCPEAADAVEGSTLEREEARARALAHLSVHDNGDGTSDGRFRLPTLHADLLRKALEALTSPRRIGEGAPRPRDREEAAAQHPARARADGAARAPPDRAAVP